MFINEDNHVVENELFYILNKCWSRETCYPKLQDKWNDKNKSLGQCLVTSLIVNDYLGGEICKCKIKRMSHYFNMINDQIYDFTKDQFGNSKIEYLNVEIKTRDTILRNKNTRERYQILREHLSQELLELDEINKEIALYPSYSSDIEKF